MSLKPKFLTKPEVHLKDLVKKQGLFKAVMNYSSNRYMWRAINDNYNLFFRNIGILKTRSWVKYLDTTVKSAIDDKTLTSKGVYVVHRFKISDDLCLNDFLDKIEHLAEKMVLSTDYQVKLNQQKIQKMGIKNYLEERKNNPDYMQSTRYITSEKEPLSRFRIFYKNGEIYFKIFFEELPVRYYKPLKPANINQILMGMDTDYNPLWWDWSKDINIYIAGATGMGKTTIVHVVLINGILYRLADFYLVDRKDSDLRPYANKKGVVAFGSSQEESTNVIELFYKEFLRRRKLFHEGEKDYINMEEYNKDHPDNPLMPYVLVVDEFADIAYECMKGDNIDMDSPLGLILKEAAQIRNTGGHNLIATQRPSADVLKGILKAQFSAQMGLRVINEINSKIVIDVPGLEHLDRHCFKIRLEGKLVDGISYYLDTPMIKKYIDELPDRKKNDKFLDVTQEVIGRLEDKIKEAEEAVLLSESFLRDAQSAMERGLKGAPKKYDTAKRKNSKAVKELEDLKKELDQIANKH